MGVWMAVPQSPTSWAAGSPFVLRPWGEVSALAQAQDAVRTEERALDCVCVWGACVVCVGTCMWGGCVVHVCAGAVALGECVGQEVAGALLPPTVPCTWLGYVRVKGSARDWVFVTSAPPFPAAVRRRAGAQEGFSTQRIDSKFSPARAQQWPGLNTCHLEGRARITLLAGAGAPGEMRGPGFASSFHRAIVL